MLEKSTAELVGMEKIKEWKKSKKISTFLRRKFYKDLKRNTGKWNKWRKNKKKPFKNTKKDQLRRKKILKFYKINSMNLKNHR